MTQTSESPCPPHSSANAGQRSWTELKRTPKNRWTQTFQSRCRLYRGKQCTYSRHVISQGREIFGQRIVKQVIRVLEDFARRGQPVFAGKEYFLKRVRKPDGSACSWRHIERCIKLVVDLGWWQRTADGYEMVSHEELANVEGDYCTLAMPEFTPEFGARSRRGRAEVAPRSQVHGSEVALRSQETEFEVVSASRIYLKEQEVWGVEPAFAQPLVMESSLVNESKNQRIIETTQTTEYKASTNTNTNTKSKTSLRPFQTYDNDQKQAGRVDPLTVGFVLERIRNKEDIDFIHALSDGEFDTRALRNYEHTTKLADRCRTSIRDMGEIIFQGRPTLAAVMGRAMEKLRDADGVDAPRGWVPVMRSLRSSENGLVSLELPAVPEPAKPIERDERGWPVTNPLFTRDTSPEHLFDDSCEKGCYFGLIWKCAGRPAVPEEWRSNLIELARELGLPSGRGFAPFMEEATKLFGALPAGLQQMLDHVNHHS